MNPEDKDPIETSEWLEAINSVIEEEGVDRASFLMTKLAKRLNEEWNTHLTLCNLGVLGRTLTCE